MGQSSGASPARPAGQPLQQPYRWSYRAHQGPLGVIKVAASALQLAQGPYALWQFVWSGNTPACYRRHNMHNSCGSLACMSAFGTTVLCSRIWQTREATLSLCLTSTLELVLIKQCEVRAHEAVVGRPHGRPKYNLIHIPAPALLLPKHQTGQLSADIVCKPKDRATWAATGRQEKTRDGAARCIMGRGNRSVASSKRQSVRTTAQAVSATSLSASREGASHLEAVLIQVLVPPPRPPVLRDVRGRHG